MGGHSGEQSGKKIALPEKSNVRWTTAINGYVLTFYIASFGNKLTGKLTQSIDNIVFFDPSKARDIAGPESRPYSPY